MPYFSNVFQKDSKSLHCLLLVFSGVQEIQNLAENMLTGIRGFTADWINSTFLFRFPSNEKIEHDRGNTSFLFPLFSPVLMFSLILFLPRKQDECGNFSVHVFNFLLYIGIHTLCVVLLHFLWTSAFLNWTLHFSFDIFRYVYFEMYRTDLF